MNHEKAFKPALQPVWGGGPTIVRSNEQILTCRDGEVQVNKFEHVGGGFMYGKGCLGPILTDFQTDTHD